MLRRSPSCFGVFRTISNFFTIDILISQVETKRLTLLTCFYHQWTLHGTVGSNYGLPFWPPSCFWSSEQFLSLSPLMFLFYKSKRREWHHSHACIIKEHFMRPLDLIITGFQFDRHLLFWSSEPFFSLSPLIFLFVKSKRRAWYHFHASIIKEHFMRPFDLISGFHFGRHLVFWSSEQFFSLSPLIFLFYKSKRREWHHSHACIIKEHTGHHLPPD